MLKPGCSFYFLEHVGGPRGTFRRSLQNFLSTYVWPLFDTCRLNKETEALIRDSGFSALDITRYKSDMWAAYIVKDQIYGRATK